MSIINNNPNKKYKYMKIGIASPEEILSWSYGEVQYPETINYRSLKPEPYGLFCEQIFGPLKDYQCSCGKSKRDFFRSNICLSCGVEITDSKVRRERFGHITLATPIVHPWYYQGQDSILSSLLDIKTRDLEEVVHYESYIVVTVERCVPLAKKQILSKLEYSMFEECYPGMFRAYTGGEAIERLLKEINLQQEATLLRKKLKTNYKQRRDKILKRLSIIESLLASNNKPEWMILEILPVLPADLRPMVQLDGGRFATTDLNDLYRQIIISNNKLKKYYEKSAPEFLVFYEKCILQKSVDDLYGSYKYNELLIDDNNYNVYKNRQHNLYDMICNKNDALSNKYYVKNVDYSGRSVAVVDSSLKMYQCGIPKEMALTLFKPFVLRELIKAGNSIAVASKLCDEHECNVWSILEEVIREHPVIISNGNPNTKFGIQAFEPVLIDDKSIHLNSYFISIFTDKNNNEVYVHLPLSLEAQAEARLLMLASNNIFNPKDGKLLISPTQDIILGIYYLTLERKGKINEGHIFKDFDEAYMAYKLGDITLHTRIFVDVSYLPTNKIDYDALPSNYLFTTMGKMIFNSILPDEFHFLNEPTEGNLCYGIPVKYFLNMKNGKASYEEMLARDEVAPFKKKQIARIIAEVFKRFQITETSRMLDRIKDLGLKYATLSGVSLSIAELKKLNLDTYMCEFDFFENMQKSQMENIETVMYKDFLKDLTRRLVDVSQDVIISTVDCGTEKGMYVEDIIDDGGKVIVTVGDRVIGRYAAKDLVNPETGELIISRNEMFTEEHGKIIDDAKIKRVCIRTNITCDSKSGVCMICYGRNLATNKVVEVGEAVGVVAAQSIGEPGTQLTMRTFHTGGVASAADITQGLPRVQELFEARKPKGKATISEIDGTVDSIEKTKSGLAVTIINDDEEKIYTIDATSELLIQVGSEIKRGDKLMKGSIHPKELLRIKDAEAVQKYIVEEVQKVYRAQSVEISDKHIEIIVRQMMRKVQVVQEGDTELLPGKDVSILEYKDAVQKVMETGGELPTAKPLLLGITKAALACQSFLSACSFQETTRILTQAAIQSKVDNLVGLKENVIIGGLIPAGTGVLVEDEFECMYKPYDIYRDFFDWFDDEYIDENIDVSEELDEDNDNEELAYDDEIIYVEDYLE